MTWKHSFGPTQKLFDLKNTSDLAWPDFQFFQARTFKTWHNPAQFVFLIKEKLCIMHKTMNFRQDKGKLWISSPISSNFRPNQQILEVDQNFMVPEPLDSGRVRILGRTEWPIIFNYPRVMIVCRLLGVTTSVIFAFHLFFLIFKYFFHIKIHNFSWSLNKSNLDEWSVWAIKLGRQTSFTHSP